MNKDINELAKENTVVKRARLRSYNKNLYDDVVAGVLQQTKEQNVKHMKTEILKGKIEEWENSTYNSRSYDGVRERIATLQQQLFRLENKGEG